MLMFVNVNVNVNVVVLHPLLNYSTTQLLD